MKRKGKISVSSPTRLAQRDSSNKAVF